MNSENSNLFDPHKILLNVTDKINLKTSDKYVALSNLKIYLQRRMINLNHMMDRIMYQIFKIILSKSSKKMKQ